MKQYKYIEQIGPCHIQKPCSTCFFCPSSLNIPQMWNYQISARMGNLQISTHELQRPDWFTRWDMVKSSEIYAYVSPNLMTWHFEPPKPYRKGHRSLKGNNNKDIRGKEQQRNWKWQEHAGKDRESERNMKEMKGNERKRLGNMTGKGARLETFPQCFFLVFYLLTWTWNWHSPTILCFHTSSFRFTLGFAALHRSWIWDALCSDWLEHGEQK